MSKQWDLPCNHWRARHETVCLCLDSDSIETRGCHQTEFRSCTPHAHTSKGQRQALSKQKCHERGAEVMHAHTASLFRDQSLASSIEHPCQKQAHHIVLSNDVGCALGEVEGDTRLVTSQIVGVKNQLPANRREMIFFIMNRHFPIRCLGERL